MYEYPNPTVLTQAFTFTPNTEAGTVAAGTLVIDPLDFGSDESGSTMTSDFEFAIVGKPVFTYAGVAAMGTEQTREPELEPA